MRAWLRLIDLTTFTSRVVSLESEAPTFVIGSAPADLVVPAPASMKRVLERHADGWAVKGQALVHGSVLWLLETAVIFLLEEPAGPDLALDAHPFDAARIEVWADSLLERGFGLGHWLRAGAGAERALEGVHGFVEAGQVQLTWKHRLIEGATVRSIHLASTQQVAVAMLLSLPIARWIRRLTIDTSRLLESGSEGLAELTLLVRALRDGPALPSLESLSFGHTSSHPLLNRATELAYRALQQRRPMLPPSAAELFKTFASASLVIEREPEGLAFHAPTAVKGRIPLKEGVWVGSATQGQLKVLPPGVQRKTAIESFIIRGGSAPELVPLDEGLRLNGRAHRGTRLIDGDVIEDRHGLRVRFEIDHPARR